jgi:hypothetical protein
VSGGHPRRRERLPRGWLVLEDVVGVGRKHEGRIGQMRGPYVP